MILNACYGSNILGPTAALRTAGIGAKAPSDVKQRSIGSPTDPAEPRAAQNNGPGSAVIVYPLG